MKNLTVLFFSVINACYGQTSGHPSKDNGIYMTAKNFQSGILVQGFNKRKGIKFLENKRLFIAIKDFDSSYLFFYDKIWGV